MTSLLCSKPQQLPVVLRTEAQTWQWIYKDLRGFSPLFLWDIISNHFVSCSPDSLVFLEHVWYTCPSFGHLHCLILCLESPPIVICMTICMHLAYPPNFANNMFQQAYVPFPPFFPIIFEVSQYIIYLFLNCLPMLEDKLHKATGFCVDAACATVLRTVPEI